MEATLGATSRVFSSPRLQMGLCGSMEGVESWQQRNGCVCWEGNRDINQVLREQGEGKRLGMRR